jgi:glycosyltransferase involved in cell wall biosynthesis
MEQTYALGSRMSHQPLHERFGHCLKVVMTMEPESWILHRFGGYFRRFSSEHLDCQLLDLDKPLPEDTDTIIYANWPHLYSCPPPSRNTPGILMVGHMDRTSFRLRYLLWRYPKLQVVCMAQRWMQTLQRYLIPAHRLHLIPHGVDLEMFQPATAAPTGARTRIGFVGRAYPDGRKGEDRLLEISRQLSKTEFEFVLVGDRWEKVVAELRENGFGVTYHRRLKTEEVPVVTKELDVLLVCARNEGGPQPVLEALACGVPVISADVGFVPDLQASMPQFITIYNEDAQAVRALASAKENRRQAQQAVSEIRQNLARYSWQTWAEGMEKLSWLAAEREVPDLNAALQPEPTAT